MDCVIEPVRSKFIPGYDNAKEMALSMGAISFGVSGSGPSMYCWVKSKDIALEIEQAVKNNLLNSHVDVDSWLSKISKEGSKIL